jgi:hypothetical protein
MYLIEVSHPGLPDCPGDNLVPLVDGLPLLRWRSLSIGRRLAALRNIGPSVSSAAVAEK